VESVRTATGGDVERLAELWDEADAEIGVQRGGVRLVGSTVRPAELDARRGPDAPLVTETDRLLAVGSIDDVVFGFVCAHVDRRPPVPVAVVEVAFVEPDARSVGIGEAMMGHVLAWAEALGCAGVDAYALPGNRTAKAFFEDNGFVTRLLTMYRPMVPPARRDRGG
jgi:GNAT superfamily N-acetyltransferase